MARAHFRDALLGVRADGALVPLPGASVTVYQAGTTTPIALPMYDAAGAVLLNPLTADGAGVVDFYLDSDERVDLSVAAAGYETATARIDVTSQDTLTGTVTFAGTAARVLADFSNATPGSRLA